MADPSTPDLQRQAGTDIGYDPRFEYRWHKIERVVWVCSTIALIVGILGLLGSGPLDKRVVTMPNGTRVQYDRIARLHAPTAILVTASAYNGSTELFVEKALSQGLGLQQLVPPPSQSIGSAGGTLFRFAGPSQPGSLVHVQLRLEPQSVGALDSALTINQTEKIQLHQFVVP